MNWRNALLGMLLGLPVVALLAFGLTRDPKAMMSPLPGRAAPEFRLAVLDAPDGRTVALADHLGEVVVLNFWASWCMECRREHAALSQAATQFRDRGVHFYGVLYNDSPENGRRYIQQMGGQTYPSLLDPNSRTAIDYGLYGVPETFFIGPDGRVAHKQIGPLSLPRIVQILTPLLEDIGTGAGGQTPGEVRQEPGGEAPRSDGDGLEAEGPGAGAGGGSIGTGGDEAGAGGGGGSAGSGSAGPGAKVGGGLEDSGDDGAGAGAGDAGQLEVAA